MENYPIVPGRGLVTPTATKLRRDHLTQNDLSTEQISISGLSQSDIRNKIESYIGSIEIPVGLIGPLLFIENGNEELIYGGAATLEGALIASMNRGAKAVSLSGGAKTTFVHQKMVRCPMFQFETNERANIFSEWLKSNLLLVKKEAEKHSNHAVLLTIEPTITGNTVHARFYYQTGDASGQNMTTTCTWHAMLWISEKFTAETTIKIQHQVIEGNGASDKKVSSHSVSNGRGVHVIAECLLKESVIEKILRTSSDAIFRCYGPSVELAKKDGMFGYNINIANAIASIFAATGQDLASIHESAVGNLYLEKRNEGLFLALSLPNLVIGTVGGGTSLPKQNEVLRMMQCEGKNKIEKFAKTIAGFALSLEISTYAAIVSGEFAKAHEKLGRNKPVNWLTRSELNDSFLLRIMKEMNPEIISFHARFSEAEVENGIITNLTSRTSKKLIGFFPFESSDANGIRKLMIKSKALDLDVIKGLHSMAASIDPGLSDLLYRFRNNTEYRNCHFKEILLYKKIHSAGFTSIPQLFGKYENADREIFLLVTEFLESDEMHLFNSENRPESWTNHEVEKTIRSITDLHQFFLANIDSIEEIVFSEFVPSRSSELYEKLISLIVREEENIDRKNRFIKMYSFLADLENRESIGDLPRTIIHNDFNPRNVAIRKNGDVCIYDWELAVKNIPHRDVVEFLAFVIPDISKGDGWMGYLHNHSCLWNKSMHDTEWLEGYIYSLKEFLVCRMSLYKTAEILMKLKFPDRVMDNCFTMIENLIQLKTESKRLAVK